MFFVSMMASTLENADGKTKAEVAEMENAVVEKAKGMAGVTAPFGFFDPLGFATTITEGKLLFYREVEIKHGRVAMLASLGFLVREVEHMVNRTQVGGRKEDMARGDGQGSEEEEEMIMHGRAAEVGNERKKM